MTGVLKRLQGYRNLINFAMFQASWFLCVLYPSTLSAVVVLALVATHLRFVSHNPAWEARFIVLATALGSLLDGAWFQLDILRSDGAIWTPVWLVAIWAIFATTLCHSLAWVSKIRWLPYVLAPISGPLSYWAASRLGVIQITGMPLAMLVLAAGWLAVFPLLLWLRPRAAIAATP